MSTFLFLYDWLSKINLFHFWRIFSFHTKVVDFITRWLFGHFKSIAAIILVSPGANSGCVEAGHVTISPFRVYIRANAWFFRKTRKIERKTHGARKCVRGRTTRREKLLGSKRASHLLANCSERIASSPRWRWAQTNDWWARTPLASARPLRTCTCIHACVGAHVRVWVKAAKQKKRENWSQKYSQRLSKHTSLDVCTQEIDAKEFESKWTTATKRSFISRICP